MWLLGQIVFYLLGAFAIGATGSWILRGRLADDSHEHLRQRFRQMVSSSEMERDAAKLRVRELSVEVRTLEEELAELRENGGVDGQAGAERVGHPATVPAFADTVDSTAAIEPALSEPPGSGPAEVSAAEHIGSLFEPAEPVDGQRGVTADVPVDEAEVVAELQNESPTGLNGVSAEAANIEVVQIDKGHDESAAALPEPSQTNGGGVGLRFELAADVVVDDQGADSSETPLELEDAVGPHTWASPDRPTLTSKSVADAPAAGRPFSDLGDIAPKTSEQLRTMGIHNTSDLHRHFQSGGSPAELARTLNVEVRKVRRWRVLSELMEVPEVGPESAWLLEISGLGSVDELAAEDPGELASRMAALNSDQGLGLPVPAKGLVASWVEWASHSASAGR